MSNFKIIGHPFERSLMDDWDIWNSLPDYEHNEQLNVIFCFGSEYNANNWELFETTWYELGMQTIFECSLLELTFGHHFAAKRFLVAVFTSSDDAVLFKLSLPDDMRSDVDIG